MERSYLEFENPIREIKDQINQTKEIGEKGKVDINATVNDLKKKLSTTTKTIFNNKCYMNCRIIINWVSELDITTMNLKLICL